MKGYITIRTHGTDILGLFFLITVHLKENDAVSILREVLQDPPLLLPVANFFATVAIEYPCYFAAVAGLLHDIIEL